MTAHHNQNRVSEFLLRIGDYYFFTRPFATFAALCIVLAGAAGWAFPKAGTPLVLLPALAGGLLFSATNILNQINDVETDRINRKNLFIADGLITKQAAHRYALALIGSVYLIALYLRNWPLVALTTVIVFYAGFMYNFGGWGNKKKPFGGSFINLLMVVVCWLFGVALVNRWTGLNGFSVLALVFSGAGVYIMSLIEDIKGDEQAGKITLAVRYGARGTARIALASMTIGLVAALLSPQLPILVFIAVGMPFFLWSAWAGKRRAAISAYRFTLLAFAGAIGIAWYPEFLLVIAVNILLARLYFRKRFNQAWPSLVEQDKSSAS